MINFFSDTQIHGEAIQLLNFKNENKSVTLTEGSLEKLFLNPLVNDREVVIISIAGALRKGKSFLLNYMLRYLYSNVSYQINYFYAALFVMYFIIYVQMSTVQINRKSR